MATIHIQLNVLEKAVIVFDIRIILKMAGDWYSIDRRRDVKELYVAYSFDGAMCWGREDLKKQRVEYR